MSRECSQAKKNNPRMEPARGQSGVEAGYAAWGERLVAEGWDSYLLTLMFSPIPGSPAQVASVMEQELIRVYATHLPRVLRHPKRLSSRGRHPVWFCAPDYPVYKRAKISKLDAFTNDGRHAHAHAFQPPWSRMSEDLATHFESHRQLYLHPEHALDRIDVVRVTHDVGSVTGYARKAIASRRVGEDATLVLPCSLKEIR